MSVVPAVRIREAELELRPYRLRLARPLQTAHGAVEAREGFVVLARRDGRVGRGEAAALPEWGIGLDLGAQLGRARGRLDALDELSGPARFAVELALLELDALEAGLPLSRLLDERAAESVPCAALIDAPDMPGLARAARRAVRDGFRTLKLKVGHAPDGDDFARAAVARDAGGDVRLRLDANGAWDAITARRKLRQFATLRVELCEQPTPDLAGLRGAVPVAADELLVADAPAALQRADVLVLKPMVLGGVLPALRLGHEAGRRGLRAFVTTSLEGAIGRAGATHLAAALGGDLAHGLATGALLAEDLPVAPLVPRDGALAIPSTPGLGV